MHCQVYRKTTQTDDVGQIDRYRAHWASFREYGREQNVSKVTTVFQENFATIAQEFSQDEKVIGSDSISFCNSNKWASKKSFRKILKMVKNFKLEDAQEPCLCNITMIEAVKVENEQNVDACFAILPDIDEMRKNRDLVMKVSLEVFENRIIVTMKYTRTGEVPLVFANCNIVVYRKVLEKVYAFTLKAFYNEDAEVIKPIFADAVHQEETASQKSETPEPVCAAIEKQEETLAQKSETHLKEDQSLDRGSDVEIERSSTTVHGEKDKKAVCNDDERLLTLVEKETQTPRDAEETEDVNAPPPDEESEVASECASGAQTRREDIVEEGKDNESLGSEQQQQILAIPPVKFDKRTKTGEYRSSACSIL